MYSRKGDFFMGSSFFGAEALIKMVSDHRHTWHLIEISHSIYQAEVTCVAKGAVLYLDMSTAPIFFRIASLFAAVSASDSPPPLDILRPNLAEPDEVHDVDRAARRAGTGPPAEKVKPCARVIMETAIQRDISAWRAIFSLGALGECGNE